MDAVCPSLTPSLARRDLSEVRNELAKASRSAHASCLNLGANLRASESSSALALDKQSARQAQLEEQLRDKVRDMIQMQARCDTEKAELNAR